MTRWERWCGEIGETWTCPNCQEDTSASEVPSDAESDYEYICDNCGCKYTVTDDMCEHGLHGWKLRITKAGDRKKNPDYEGD